MPFDATLLLPGQDGVRSQLSPIVADHHAGIAAQFSDPIELASDPQAGERGVDYEGEAFPGEVIDHSEDAEAAAAYQRVSHEERPAKIAILRDSHRRSGTDSPLATATLAPRQPLLSVEPIELLRAQLDALSLQHQSQAPIAEPPPL